MAGIYSQGGSAGHHYAGWLSEVEAKNFQFGGKVFNGSPSAIYVGSNLAWLAYGLKDAAMRAILGAFGQTDGKAVINATNAYLNQLAASGQAGKDKATALAGFINEDPMMVCSLGLEPEGMQGVMPIRRAKGNGSTYVKLGDYDLSVLSYDVKAWLYDLEEYDVQLIGGDTWSYSNFITQIAYGQICNTMCDGSTRYALNSHDISMSQINNVVTIQGRVKNRNASFSGTKAIYILSAGNSHQSKGGVSSIMIQSALEFTDAADWFLPTERNGAVELVNIRTGQYAYRSGALTIALENPSDGTPWTPSTQ